MTNAERIKEIEDRTAKAIKALDVGGTSGAFLCVMPIGEDIPWLLSTLRAVEANNARLRAALEVCVEVLCESANLNNYRNLSDEELGRAWMTAHTLGTAALQDPRP